MCFSTDWMFYILVLTLVCTTLSTDPDPTTICPPSELIHPCVCTKECAACVSEVKCEHITDQEILSRLFTSQYQFQTFSLLNSSVLYMPDSIFEVDRLHYLLIGQSSLVSLFNNIAENSIRRIDLEQVRIVHGVEWQVLAGFPHLTAIAIMDMDVPKIDRRFVDYAPKSLDEVRLYNCSTNTIHDRAFAGLPDIKRVSVMFGNVQVVKRSMFPALSKLELLDFSWNHISSLPEDIFSEMPYLKYISLLGNYLKEMPENTFRPIFPALEYFKFDYNPLKCRCDIRWITVVKKWMDPGNLRGVCMEPKNLHGKEIKDLVPADFYHCG